MTTRRFRSALHKASIEVPFMIDQMSQRNSKEETDAGSSAYPAEKARQGEIILRKPWQRIVFIVGLLAPLGFFLIGWLLLWKWS